MRTASCGSVLRNSKKRAPAAIRKTYRTLKWTIFRRCSVSTTMCRTPFRSGLSKPIYSIRIIGRCHESAAIGTGPFNSLEKPLDPASGLDIQYFRIRILRVLRVLCDLRRTRPNATCIQTIRQLNAPGHRKFRPRSKPRLGCPWENGYSERLIRTLMREDNRKI